MSDNELTKALCEESLTCPARSSSFKVNKVKTHLYTEKVRDIDLRPRELHWNNKAYSSIIPRYFFVRNCGSCGFTASKEMFEKPTKGTALSSSGFAEHLKALKKKDSTQKVQEILSGKSEGDIPSFTEALKLHLNALYTHQNSEHLNEGNPFEVGRYALRLAWFYRDLGESPSVKKEFGKDVDSILSALAKVWKEVPRDEEAALVLAIDSYQRALTGSRVISGPKEEVEVSLLVTRIAFQAGDIPQARKFLE